LRCPQRAEFLSTLNLAERSPRYTSIFHYQILRKERTIQTF
jgi:hypothetical protein